MGSIQRNEETVRKHYNRFFDLQDRQKMYADCDWTQRPPIVNLGYWTRGAVTARDAQVAFVQELASRLTNLRGSRVLDVGSGLAGPAVILAADYGAEVDCLNINEQQVQWARRFIEGNGLQSSIRVHVASAMDIVFRSEFDFVFCLESAHCYADKSRFLSGALNALRPGGHLLLADIAGTTHFLPAAYQPALKLNLITSKDWIKMTEKAGFVVESCDSVRDCVYPGYRHWLKGTAAERRTRIFNKLSEAGTSVPLRPIKQVKAWALELAYCRSVLPLFSWLGLRDYFVILARKGVTDLPKNRAD
jgi:cyclopropane fatty-acyl-phospholipid synthase-like methyltransferase